MITVQSLTRKYGSFTAVDDITFTAQPGRVTGFLGPNGAGKSTTMRMILGLDAPTAGTVRVNGKAARVMRYVPSTFTRNSCWKSASAVSSIPPTSPMPALFTSTSSV